jgi:hypothetical protein
LTEGALYGIVEDLCIFILKEVIPAEGKYHDASGTLALPEFRILIEFNSMLLLISILHVYQYQYIYIYIYMFVCVNIYKFQY